MCRPPVASGRGSLERRGSRPLPARLLPARPLLAPRRAALGLRTAEPPVAGAPACRLRPRPVPAPVPERSPEVALVLERSRPLADVTTGPPPDEPSVLPDNACCAGLGRREGTAPPTRERTCLVGGAGAAAPRPLRPLEGRAGPERAGLAMLPPYFAWLVPIAKKAHALRAWASWRKLPRRRPTLPGGRPPSTIGAGGLNFRVRDGNGCGPTAIATGNSAQF